MVVMLFSKINFINLTIFKPQFMLSTIPIVILSFTANVILPNLRQYLENDIAAMKKVIIVGSLIPLVIYLLWVMIILGVIPYSGNYSILDIAKSVDPIAQMSQVIAANLKTNIVAQNNNIFSFCALTTSFLGVLVSLKGFLADGLNLQETKKNRLLLFSLCLFPPFLIIFFVKSLFLTALSYGGIFIAIIYGILPVLMVWKARYVEQIKGSYTFPGGKLTLLCVLLVATIIIICQIGLTNGWLLKF